MTSPGLAFQKALVSVLRGATAAGANVFDTVPPSDPFPRITIGPRQMLPLDGECVDATEIHQQLDAWSRAVGFPEVETVAAEIRTILDDASFALDGHSLQLLVVTDINVGTDPDGITRRARISLRAEVQPST